VNNGVRNMALEVLEDSGRRKYALGMYRNKDHPFHAAGRFQSLLSRPEVLPIYPPELNCLSFGLPPRRADKCRVFVYRERFNLGLLTHASCLLASSASQGLTATLRSLSIDPLFTTPAVVGRVPRDLVFLLTRLQRSSLSFRPQLSPGGARRARLSAPLLRLPNAILHRIGVARR
jgi:hypothetical protein